jgi:hypothetical protein
MYTGIKVYIEHETIGPYKNYWVIKEIPSGKLFQVFREKESAYSAIRGYGLQLQYVIRMKR